MNDNATNADGVRGVAHTAGGVAKQGAAQAASLERAVHRQTSQQYNRNRIGHVPPEPARSACRGDSAGGEGVVADDPIALTNYIGTRRAAHLIRPRPAFQPVVQRGFPAVEVLDLMRFG